MFWSKSDLLLRYNKVEYGKLPLKIDDHNSTWNLFRKCLAKKKRFGKRFLNKKSYVFTYYH